MPKNTFLLCSNISEELLATYPQIHRIEAALYQQSLSKGQNLEKLRGIQQYVPYSIRLNKKARIICIKIKIDGESYWVLLDIMENHRYERLSLSDIVPRSLARDFEYLKSQINTDLEKTALTEQQEYICPPEELHSYQEQFILIN